MPDTRATVTGSSQRVHSLAGRQAREPAAAMEWNLSICHQCQGSTLSETSGPLRGREQSVEDSRKRHCHSALGKARPERGGGPQRDGWR